MRKDLFGKVKERLVVLGEEYLCKRLSKTCEDAFYARIWDGNYSGRLSQKFDGMRMIELEDVVVCGRLFKWLFLQKTGTLSSWVTAYFVSYSSEELEDRLYGKNFSFVVKDDKDVSYLKTIGNYATPLYKFLCELFDVCFVSVTRDDVFAVDNVALLKKLKLKFKLMVERLCGDIEEAVVERLEKLKGKTSSSVEETVVDNVEEELLGEVVGSEL